MNVRIITLKLWGNYGSMLQAYALYQLCVKLGGCPMVVQMTHKPLQRLEISVSSVRSFIVGILRALQINCLPLHYEPSCVAKNLGRKAKRFCAKFISCIDDEEESKCQDKKSYPYIVGSDQVWRSVYARMHKTVPFFFLDFATEEQRRKSIAYAASFGADEWEGTPEETERCRELIKQFKAVSVREYSGIEICRQVFGVEAVQMPDPTLLASMEDYERVIDSETTRCPKSSFFASYVLDGSAEVSQLLDEVERTTGLYHQRLMPKSMARRRSDRFYCTVAQWLRYIRDCEVAITDSFHGCVFSIIYNKPFVCLGNELRGMARFDTLFKTFGLEERLVLSRDPEEVLRVLRMPIDWDRVNAIHESERQRGLDFLRNNLYDGTPSNPHA